MCCLELVSERRLSTDMQVATASVSIAPFPALENDVKDAFDELTVRLEEVGKVAEAIGKLADVPCKVEEVTDDQVTPVSSKLRRQKAFLCHHLLRRRRKRLLTLQRNCHSVAQ